MMARNRVCVSNNVACMTIDAGLVEQIDAILPQTQCRKCGFQGCKPYAQAMAYGEVDINRCPPGGEAGIRRLALLLGRAVKPLDPSCGIEQPRLLAVIKESDCIGCTKCLPPCPVDAIVGASKLMHTVLVELCTGCALCIEACPVDCIRMEPAPIDVWSASMADDSRRRFQVKQQRLAQQEIDKKARLEKQKQMLARLGKA